MAEWLEAMSKQYAEYLQAHSPGQEEMVDDDFYDPAENGTADSSETLKDALPGAAQEDGAAMVGFSNQCHGIN